MLVAAAALAILASTGLSLPDADAEFIRGLPARGDDGLVVELLVNPDRSVERCKVLSRVTEVAAESICDQAKRLKLRRAALDLDGKAIHGFLNVARIPRDLYERRGGPPPMYLTDLEVSVRDVPGRDTLKIVYVTVLVDETGSVTYCQPEPDQDERFAKVACQQATQAAQPVVRSGGNTPVRYVRTLRVDFVEEATPQ